MSFWELRVGTIDARWLWISVLPDVVDRNRFSDRGLTAFPQQKGPADKAEAIVSISRLIVRPAPWQTARGENAFRQGQGGNFTSIVAVGASTGGSESLLRFTIDYAENGTRGEVFFLF